MEVKFKDVLQELMINHDVDVSTLSKALDIDDSNLYDYKNHGAIPNLEFANRIANYFNCSLNFLMGLDEKLKDFTIKPTYNTTVFYDRYKQLVKLSEFSHNKIAKLANFSQSGYATWQKGAVPKMETLIKIAKFFSCSIDYLVGKSDKQ